MTPSIEWNGARLAVGLFHVPTFAHCSEQLLHTTSVTVGRWGRVLVCGAVCVVASIVVVVHKRRQTETRNSHFARRVVILGSGTRRFIAATRACSQGQLGTQRLDSSFFYGV